MASFLRCKEMSGIFFWGGGFLIKSQSCLSPNTIQIKPQFNLILQDLFTSHLKPQASPCPSISQGPQNLAKECGSYMESTSSWLLLSKICLQHIFSTHLPLLLWTYPLNIFLFLTHDLLLSGWSSSLPFIQFHPRPFVHDFFEMVLRSLAIFFWTSRTV